MTDSDAPYDFAPRKPETPPASERPAAETPPSPTPPQGRLVERTCPQCGYRIMGKPRGNRCPECRAPMEIDKGAGEPLQFADAGWIRGLSWGALLLVPVAPLHVAAAWVAEKVGDRMSGMGLNLLAAVLAGAGAWLLTRRAPALLERKKPGWGLGALALRAVAGLNLLTWIGALVAAARWTPESWWLTGGLASGALLALTLGWGAGALARRVPHEGLVNQFRAFTWLVPALCAAVAGCLWMDVTPYYTIFFCSFPLIGLLNGAALWIGVTLLRFFLELRAAATAADAIVEKQLRAAEKANTPPRA